MKARNEIGSRGEVTDTVDRSQGDMREKEGGLEKIADDVEVVRQTLENLDFGGTAEGTEAVEEAVRGAEDVTEETFDREDQELDEVQGRDEEYQGELQEHSEASDADLDKLSEASGQIDTRETVNESVKAKEAALRDVEFLAEQIRRAQEARDESERTQSDYENRVHSRAT